MLKIALLYRSREGQTLKILNKLSSSLRESGHSVTLFDLSDGNSSFDVDHYDAFLLGCSIRYGRHHKDFCHFVDRYASVLNAKPSFFFSVNLTARKPERCRPDNNRYLMKYLQSIRWKPALVEVFAGALLYSRYGFFSKRMIQLIMKLTGGNTDTSKDIEYTDWQRVADFSRAVDQHLLTPKSHLVQD